jgi:hypothetical protein
MGGGVQLGPLGTAATDWPAPGDHDDGEFSGIKIGKGKGNILRKSTSAPLGFEPGPPRWEASD